MDAPVRPDIASGFGRWLTQLQFKGQSYREGAIHELYGIIYVPDPYSSRKAEN